MFQLWIVLGIRRNHHRNFIFAHSLNPDDSFLGEAFGIAIAILNQQGDRNADCQN